MLLWKLKRHASNFLSSSFATVYRTPEELGRAAVLSEVFNQSSNREKSSRNFCHSLHVSSILEQKVQAQSICCVTILKSLRQSGGGAGGGHSLEPPLHGHGADVPPASVQPPGGLLDGVALCLRGTRVAVVQQDLAQVQHRRHACAVLLDVPLQILETKKDNTCWLVQHCAAWIFCMDSLL